MKLQKGQKAPDFTLPSTDGGEFTLSSQKGKYVLLFFYPKDFTTGCTAEACSFNDNMATFNGLNCTVVGISTDSINSHLKFKKEFNLEFELLSDRDGGVSKKYNALLPFINTSKRITYLIDPEGKIESQFSSMFNAKKHVSEMLKIIE